MRWTVLTSKGGNFHIVEKTLTNAVTAPPTKAPTKAPTNAGVTKAPTSVPTTAAPTTAAPTVSSGCGADGWCAATGDGVRRGVPHNADESRRTASP